MCKFRLFSKSSPVATRRSYWRCAGLVICWLCTARPLARRQRLHSYRLLLRRQFDASHTCSEPATSRISPMAGQAAFVMYSSRATAVADTSLFPEISTWPFRLAGPPPPVTPSLFLFPFFNLFCPAYGDQLWKVSAGINELARSD